MEPDDEQIPPDSPVFAPDRPTPPDSTAGKWYRGRPGVIVLTAFLAELVLIGGGANQAVAKSLQKYAADRVSTMPDYTAGAINSALTFQWRFAAANGQPTHLWGAQFAGIGTLFVLTALFGWAVSRGSVTFGRIWVSIGAAVLGSTVLAVMVRNLLIQPASPGPLQSRFGQSVYGYAGFGPVIVEGLLLGLVVGFFAALLAVITRTRLNLVVASDGGTDEMSGPIPANAYGVPTPGYTPPPWQQYPEPAPPAWPPVTGPDAPFMAPPMSPPAPSSAAMPPGAMPTTVFPAPVPPPPWRSVPDSDTEGHTAVIPIQPPARPQEPAAPSAPSGPAPSGPAPSGPAPSGPAPSGPAPTGPHPSDGLTEQIPVVPADAPSADPAVTASGHSSRPLVEPDPDPALDFDEDQPAG